MSGRFYDNIQIYILGIYSLICGEHIQASYLRISMQIILFPTYETDKKDAEGSRTIGSAGCTSILREPDTGRGVTRICEIIDLGLNIIYVNMGIFKIQ
jgi:hypothetical protein